LERAGRLRSVHMGGRDKPFDADGGAHRAQGGVCKCDFVLGKAGMIELSS
jgi:hypothetical protein